MLSDDVRRALLDRRDWRPKANGERVHFRCPRHEDREPSAWMGGGAWGCFACGFQEPITTLASELGVALEGSANYTLEDYADEKGLSVAKLREWGLRSEQHRDRTVVRIPYRDESGRELRARYRSRPSASHSGKWWEGKGRPIYLYGLDRLVDAKQGDRVLVVEGESDCHALWSADILAVGVPGATAWRAEWAEHLSGLEVYVWEEPDQGGAQMVERLLASFPEARVIRPEGVKDPCQLRQRDPGRFREMVEAMMDGARPDNAPEPPVAFDVLDRRRFGLLLEHQLSPIDAVPTPFPRWNRSSRDEGGGVGIARGWHVLAAARTGTGKSILALNFSAHAMRVGEKVCFVSLEMSQRQVETRLMAILSGEPIERIEKGRYFDEATFRRAAKCFDHTPGSFCTNRAPIHTARDVVRSMQAVYEIHGPRFFVVDYLQLAANPNDPESIMEVSHAVRAQARELQVITLGLSQFNRKISTLNESPYVEGLMGGSSLENDADQVALIDHSTVEEVQHAGSRIGWNADLLLAKNRHGPTGAIPINFSTRNLQMRELLDDEIPANPKRGAVA